MEKKMAQIGGQNIAYYRGGQGDKTCVILHGWGTNIETMMGVYKVLEKNFQVYLYDAPGFGQSEDPKEVWGTGDYAQFLYAFCQHFSISKAHFIGHSFGGKTLSLFAGDHPDLVDKLVLIDASGILPKRGFSYYARVYSFKAMKKLYLLTHPSKDREERLRKFYARFGSDDYQNSQGTMRKVFVKVVNESTRDELAKIQAPTLLVWGEEDDDTPLWMGKIFEEEIPDAGLVVLKGGHYAYAEDYGTFSAVLKSFLLP